MQPGKPPKSNPVAGKEPAEVAGLGRAETPEESRARIAKARAERRGRQTIRNLVWSMLASLGVVAVLIFVVVRPDTSLVEPVNWQAVASGAADQLPGDPVTPELSDRWSANRAEISTAPGTSIVWSLGFISPESGFVFVDQGFGADSRWLGLRTRQALPTGERVFEDAEGIEITWIEYDRREADPSGNYAYLLSYTSDQSTIVVGGTTKDAVLEVAGAVAKSLSGDLAP